MTDRIKGFTVTLEEDIRIDDVEDLLSAVGMLKGVVHVEPSISTGEDHMNRQMISMDIKKKLYKFTQEL